jgi:hypothetical protein
VQKAESRKRRGRKREIVRGSLLERRTKHKFKGGGGKQEGLEISLKINSN